MIGSRYRRILAQPLASLLALRRRFLPSPRVVKSHEVYVALGSWTFGRAPRRPLAEIFPGIRKTSIELKRLCDRTPGTSIEPAELATICAVVRHLEPMSIVEIGTFDGNTALNLAANSPEGSQIWTVDLPPDGDQDLAIEVPAGMRNSTLDSRLDPQYKDTELAAKITELLCDSATLDWRVFAPAVDLVFIDGCHYHDYVLHDTEQALLHLSSKGTIIWHDYGISVDVSRAVDSFSSRLSIEAVRGQRLAIGRRIPARKNA